MRYYLLVVAFLSLSSDLFGQDLFVVSARQDWFDAREVDHGESYQVAYFSQELLDNHDTCCMLPSDDCLTESNEETLLRVINDKKVLVLIHGMAKNWGQANKDFYNLYWSSTAHLGEYDVVIALSWPGDGHLGVAPYFFANKNTQDVALRMGHLFQEVSSKAGRLDFVTHSMGSKVLGYLMREHEVEASNTLLLAPSIFRKKMKKGRKWHALYSSTKEHVVVAYSNYDFAFSWTWVQHMGMGYNGMPLRKPEKYPRLVQLDCSEVINQPMYRRLPGGPFKSRSNHSMYTQSEPVFEAIADVLSKAVQDESSFVISGKGGQSNDK